MGEYHPYLIVTAHRSRSTQNIITGGDGLNLGEEDNLEVRNHAVLAAVAFMMSSISSLVRLYTRGIPKCEFVTDGVTHGRMVVVYLVVMTERFSQGYVGPWYVRPLYIGCYVGSLKKTVIL